MEILTLVLVVLVGILTGYIVLSKKKSLSYCEWSQIYWNGYNSGVKGAADVLESFAFDEANRDAAYRWSGLIRQLKHRSGVPDAPRESVER